MKVHPLVTIQILNWNRSHDTIKAIESALNQTYKSIEIIVIDNGSFDNSIEEISTKFPDIPIIQLAKNYGCPEGRNKGIEFCSGNYIFFLDNDGVLHKDAIKNAMVCMETDNNIAIVDGNIIEFSDTRIIDVDYTLPPTSYSYVNNFNGGVSLHKKINFLNISQYPSDYIYGGEEGYLTLKIINSGQSIVKCKEVVMWHRKSDQARRREKEIISSYNNKLMTAFQLYPIEYFFIYLIYYIVVYPFYSYKDGVLFRFVSNMIPSFVRMTRYSREPVSRKTIREYLKK
jgi:GT2 family glycosyltransferase